MCPVPAATDPATVASAAPAAAERTPRRRIARTDPPERRFPVIWRRLQREYPDAKCALHFSNPYEMLFATMLSAQTTDARMEQLLTLPGVARKTANVVLGNAFGKVEGIAVDTHVRRLARRLGLTTHDEPDKIEQDLMRLVPKPRWFHLTYLFIEHGRKVCKAPTPRCEDCVLADLCPSSRV